MDNYIKLIMGILAISALIFTFNPTIRMMFNNTHNPISSINAQKTSNVPEDPCANGLASNLNQFEDPIVHSNTHHKQRCYEQTDSHCESGRVKIDVHNGNCNVQCDAGKHVFVTKAEYSNMFDFCSSKRMVNIFETSQTTEKVHALCKDQQTCNFQIGKDDAWLGYDPFPKCFKKLDIEYLCVDPSTKVGAKLTCKEDHPKHTNEVQDCNIDCVDKAIFVTKAQFGNVPNCHDFKGNNLRVNKFAESDETRATRGIKILCEGRQRCTFHIKGNGKSFLGDPAPGCWKHLDITYFCAAHDKPIQEGMNYGRM